ncbi:hypothetical protein [Methylobacterium sp. Leaf456]|uniref:hypothetical protein n=1 Tax=Methylobacterium sp. Leaf456 TaxID=1736382 RepID=UPI000ACAF147|nr:hypothetical protein [Methylobacterium sp. Leaf456]
MTTSARIWLAASLIGAGFAAPLATAPALAQKADATKQKAAPAPAEKPTEAPKPVELTQAKIDGVLAAQPELAKIDAGSPDKPDPKAEAKAQGEAEAIVKRNGFASLDEFQDTSESIDAVLEGIDPQTKSYVGITPLLKKQLAALEADKTMPAKDKAAAVKELKGAIAAGEPGGKPPEGNIALVTQNYEKLSAALGPDDAGDDKDAGKDAPEPAKDASGKAAGKK